MGALLGDPASSGEAAVGRGGAGRKNHVRVQHVEGTSWDEGTGLGRTAPPPPTPAPVPPRPQNPPQLPPRLPLRPPTSPAKPDGR